jgi:hypothetical protein
VRVLSHNLTQVVDDSAWAALQAVLGNLAVPQDGRPSAVIRLELVNISHGEPTPRNVPAHFFNPPVPPPNFWVNRSVFVFVTGQTPQVPTCAQLRQTDSQWAARGFTMDWSACRIQVLRRAFQPEPSISRLVSTVDPDSYAWRRSTKDFDRSVVPAVVIAAFLLLLTLIYLLLRLCCRMRPWHRQQQRFGEQMKNEKKNKQKKNSGSTIQDFSSASAPFFFFFFLNSTLEEADASPHPFLTQYFPLFFSFLFLFSSLL